VASDYQGETIQVFVFLRGKFLGYQCFAQDRLTIGGAPGMDLPLPGCPEEEGYWDVYFSRGALYAWFRGPAGSERDEGQGDPRKVQPLDSFSLGDYRLQLKLLDAQGFVDASEGPEEDLAEDGAADIPEEEHRPAEGDASHEEEGPVASSSEEPDQEDGAEQEPLCDTAEVVEGISIEYARSIWAGREREAADEEASGNDTTDEWIGFGLEEEGQAEEEAQSLDAEPEDPGEEEAEGDLSTLADEEGPEEGAETGPVEGAEAAEGAPDEEPISEDDKGLEAAQDVPEDELISMSEGADLPDPEDRPRDLEELEETQDMVAPEAAEEPEVDLPPVAASGGLVEGMSQEERTSFWDQMAKEALANKDQNREQGEPEEAPVEGSSEAEVSSEKVIEDVAPSEAEVDVDQDETLALEAADEAVASEDEDREQGEPAFARERLESDNTAVAMDDAEAAGEEVNEEGWEDEDEEEQYITYFSLVKQVFPSRTQGPKTPHGDRRALEVVRFRGRDVQDIGYLEGGSSYTIRKG